MSPIAECSCTSVTSAGLGQSLGKGPPPSRALMGGSLDVTSPASAAVPAVERDLITFEVGGRRQGDAGTLAGGTPSPGPAATRCSPESLVEQRSAAGSRSRPARIGSPDHTTRRDVALLRGPRSTGRRGAPASRRAGRAQDRRSLRRLHPRLPGLRPRSRSAAVRDDVDFATARATARI